MHKSKHYSQVHEIAGVNYRLEMKKSEPGSIWKWDLSITQLCSELGGGPDRVIYEGCVIKCIYFDESWVFYLLFFLIIYKFGENEPQMAVGASDESKDVKDRFTAVPHSGSLRFIKIFKENVRTDRRKLFFSAYIRSALEDSSANANANANAKGNDDDDDDPISDLD